MELLGATHTPEYPPLVSTALLNDTYTLNGITRCSPARYSCPVATWVQTPHFSPIPTFDVHNKADRIWSRWAKLRRFSVELRRPKYDLPSGRTRSRGGLRGLFTRRPPAVHRWRARGPKDTDMGYVQRLYCGRCSTRSRAYHRSRLGGHGQVCVIWSTTIDIVRRETNRVQVLRSIVCGTSQQPGEGTSGSDSVCRPASSCRFTVVEMSTSSSPVTPFNAVAQFAVLCPTILVGA